MYCNNCGTGGGPMHVHQGLNYCSDECIEAVDFRKRKAERGSASFNNDMQDAELEENLGYRFHDDECRGNQW